MAKRKKNQKVEDNFEKNLEVKANIAIPFTIIAVFSLLVSIACFYYGHGYYGLITVGSIGSILMLFTLVRTKRSLEDELEEYQKHGPFITQTDYNGSVDKVESYGLLTIYENGFVVGPENGTAYYIEFKEVTAFREMKDGEWVVIMYHENGVNHIFSFASESRLRVKAVVQAVSSHISIPEIEPDMIPSVASEQE